MKTLRAKIRIEYRGNGMPDLPLCNCIQYIECKLNHEL